MQVPLVVTRSPEHIKYLLGKNGTEDFPRPPNVIDNIKLMFGRAQIALDGKVVLWHCRKKMQHSDCGFYTPFYRTTRTTRRC